MHLIIFLLVFIFIVYRVFGRSIFIVLKRPIAAIFGVLTGISVASYLGELLGFTETIGHLWWKKEILPGFWLWGWGFVGAVFFSQLSERYHDWKY